MSSKLNFTHLHCHTQYSLLDGAAKISSLFAKAKSQEMTALAITDHGNMFGVPQFVSEAKKCGIKPIIGCEFYVAKDRFDYRDNKRYHQIILAKNKKGYENLIKLCSIGYTEGYYYKPRIDLDAIVKYREGLIATTCCLGSEVCKSILNGTEEEAERCFLKWMDVWGEDYFIEVQPPYSEEQKRCNEVLLGWSKKYKVPAIATNDVHYVNESDSVAQDILVCLQTGKDYNDPSRMKFSGSEFFLKSTEEMSRSFPNNLEVIENTQLVVDKIETISLNRDILMPIYNIPEEFKSQYDYLYHLTITGALRKYTNITEAIQTRIDFELSVIRSMGFEGYFLVVQDFISAAKNLGVAVGPGRGSVVGSIVAYCIDITNVCPLQYNLIFERFLNPERISMPDIDIDFDDIGRDRVIKYVTEKYGQSQVAQIVTFGSMGAKSAIKDVARVIGLPLERANYLSKLIPDKPGVSLSKALIEISELNDIVQNKGSLESKVLSFAETLEGSARHTGVHAAGVIIAPDDITKFIPVKKDKDSDFLITQYEGSVVESVGMLKMDFLGLKSLTIIKDAISLIKKNHNVEIDLDKLPLDDKKTFELYKAGETTGTFQFESEGMKQWLIKLQPTDIEDLIAMNALYRPGPMQFIPNYIARKHKKEAVEYSHPLLEEVVKNTFGIMIYQEQIIRAAQVMAGYTPGSADILRKAMGKKNPEEMARQREIFVAGAMKYNGVEREKSLEVFEIMEKFAQYGFNRSHATAYAIIAYQTGYLKANFKAEFLCTLLSHNQDDIEKITTFIGECKRHNIQVLSPCVNNSNVSFDVINGNEIRFGLAAIKGIGTNIAETIVKVRDRKFIDIFDFVERVPGINKRVLEALALSGALDCFEDVHRRQYIYTDEANINGSFIEKLIKYLNQLKESKASERLSLFGLDDENLISVKKPSAPSIEAYSDVEKLKFEKEIIGFYISGHPLERYEFEINNVANCNTCDIYSSKLKNVKIIGIITDFKKKISKNGKPYYRFLLEDLRGNIELVTFGVDKSSSGSVITNGMQVLVSGTLLPSFKDADSLELKISEIHELDFIRSNCYSTISANINLDIFTDSDANSFIDIVHKNPGIVPFEINIPVESKRKNLTLVPKNKKLNLSGNALNMLTKIKSLSFSATLTIK